MNASAKSIRGLTLAFLVSASAYGQSMTSVTPSNGPGGTFVTITGSGFSTVAKRTRFVDGSGRDIVSGVTCSSTTSCTGTVINNLTPPGTILNIAVFALVNDTSASSAQFRFFGAPIITSLVPNRGPRSSQTPLTINGGAFPSGATYPGIADIVLFNRNTILQNGCGSTTQCAFTAPALDFSACDGDHTLNFSTPGGTALARFVYGTPPPPGPTITSISPKSGNRNGGTVVLVNGTGFSTTPGATMFTFDPNGTPAAATCSSSTTCTLTTPGGNGRSHIRVDVPNCSPGSVNTVADDFTYAGLDIQTYQSTVITSEAGVAATYNIALTTAPSADVVVTLSKSGMVAEGNVSPTQLIFTQANWNQPRTITVTPVDDVAIDGNQFFSINSSVVSADADYNNVSSNSVSVTNIDNETAGYLVNSIQPLTTAEGGPPASFTVVLNKLPASQVVIELNSSDPTEGTVSPASLTFTTANWNVTRTATITPVNDGIVDGDIAYSIIMVVKTSDATYDAISLNDVFITNEDNEKSGVKGDFSLDQTPDLMWRNYSTGENTVSFMAGPGLINTVPLLSVADANWRLEGSGDFDGNNSSDLLWRNYSTGAVNVWFMNGTTYLYGVSLFSVADMNWQIEGVADFNNDKKVDLIWRNYSTGAVNVWYLDGTVYTGGASLFTVADPNWRLEGTGDFDEDGDPDLIWRNYSTGEVNIWYLQNGTYAGGANLFTVADPLWKIQAIQDYTGDGRTDLVWRHYGTGAVNLWRMHGVQFQAGSTLFTITPLSWEIAGPR